MASGLGAGNEAIAAMREMYARVVRGDWEGYLSMLSQDYVSLGPDGETKDRKRTVEDWRIGSNVLELEVEPIVARPAGDVVFVFAKYRCIDEKRQGTREFEGSMFEVWMKMGPAWRCLATHFT